MRALRVALLCPYSLSVPGGVQAQVLGLARALRRDGVDARVIAPCDGPPPEAGVIAVGATRGFPANGSVAPITSNKAVADRTLEALRTFAPDVLHLHEPLTPGPTHAALVGTDLPSVGTFHAAHPGANGWYERFNRPLRAMAGRLDVCTAVSAEARRNVVDTFRVECEIVPNGIDIDAFDGVAPYRDGAADRPTVMFIGRHEPRKGLAVLLDAFARLGPEAGRPRLWVAGSGPTREALRARGVADVEWLGEISDDEKMRRMRAATVACFPSTSGESFGVVLLEAMAAGAPIVASDLVGYRTVVGDDGHAVLVPPGDAGALAAALTRVLTDASLRARLSVGGRSRAGEFAMARVAGEYRRLFERLAGAAGSARPTPLRSP